MRLTLRTLLAYLDDVLPPEEAETLRKRIEESEFASTLVQRIRHTLKRSRLNAPKLEGKGLGSDPNNVAEYLDSVLASDRMSDFERGCLESDVHLAEVAACHQILCKVLHQPAQITVDLRNKLHSLPALLEAGKAPSLVERHRAPEDHDHEESVEKDSISLQPMQSAPQQPQPAPMQQVPLERPKPEVPDYLKPEPSNSRFQLLGVLAFMSIAAVVLLVISPLGKQWLSPANTSKTEVAVENSGDSTNTTIPKNDVPATNPDDNSNTTEEKTKGDAAANDKTITESLDIKKLPDDKNPAPPEPESPDLKTVPETKIPVENNDTKPEMAVEKTIPVEKTATEEPKPEVKPETTSPEKEPVATAELGRFISDETVLARLSKNNNWMRVAPRTLIVSGEPFISLPVYRPQIALSSGVQVTLAGEGSFRFDRGKTAPIGLSAEYGRFLLITSGASQASIDLDLNGISGVLTLPTADSQAAVELYNYVPPGQDPQAIAPLPVAYIYALNGTISWESIEEESVTIAANHTYVLPGKQEPFMQGPIKLPAWVDAKNTPSLDREAAKLAEALLSVERPLQLSLEEIADHRRIDVRVHVARCLASLGSCETIMRHLAVEDYRPYAPLEIETLRQQISRGGAVAFEMQTQLEKLRGSKDGAALYRLLYGFDSTQLVSEGRVELLLECLENAHADIRWLAFDNLKRITGVGHSYNPALPAEKNRSALVRWSKMFKDGEIDYAVKPSPLLDLAPLPPAQPAVGEPEAK